MPPLMLCIGGFRTDRVAVFGIRWYMGHAEAKRRHAHKLVAVALRVAEMSSLADGREKCFCRRLRLHGD
jgi:hypothetical protein